MDSDRREHVYDEIQHFALNSRVIKSGDHIIRSFNFDAAYSQAKKQGYRVLGLVQVNNRKDSGSTDGGMLLLKSFYDDGAEKFQYGAIIQHESTHFYSFFSDLDITLRHSLEEFLPDSEFD